MVGVRPYAEFTIVLSDLCGIHVVSMTNPEDSGMMGFIGKFFRGRIGIIKNALCLHATGPAYAEKRGLLKREKEKYVAGRLPELAQRLDCIVND